MAKTACTVPITQIILDEEIYPREGVYPKRVSMFAENMRDGFEINPIEVQIHPEYRDKYRILDGAHRWHAYKEIGATEIPVHIITLDDLDPLLYAAKKAIGPLQLSEEEARKTARRAYENNPRLTSVEIGRAIGRSRQTVDIYVADLRASNELEIDLKIFSMNRVGISQERIAQRLGQTRDIIRMHLGKMPLLAKSPNTDLSKRFTVPQVAKSMVGQSLLCGPLPWRAKAILIDSRHLTGDCAHGICGTGMTATNVSVMTGPAASRPK